MTTLEALQSKVSYPLSTTLYESILIERGLDGMTNFTQEVAKSKEFKLCQADCWACLVGATQIQEGSVSINLTDKSNFIKMANAIYSEFGEPLIGNQESKKFVPTGRAKNTW